MASHSLNPKLNLVPGYVHDINEVARNAGLTVDVRIGTEDGRDIVISRWSGTYQQFADTQLFNLSTRFPIIDDKQISVTGCLFVSGRIIKRGSVFTLTDDYWLPITKSVQGGVEMMDFGVEGGEWFGTREALLAAGILTDKHFPRGGGKLPRTTKAFRPDHCSLDRTLRSWRVTMRPGGKYLYWVESEASRAKEIADKSDWVKRHAQTPEYAGECEKETARSLGSVPNLPCDDRFIKFLDAAQGELRRVQAAPKLLRAAEREASELYARGRPSA